jgi:hypothetical protein
MSPNLFLATQKLFSPHKWFRESKSPRTLRKTEYWDDGPVPGLYEYIPGRGWYLIATLKDVSAGVSESKASEEGGPVQPPPSKEYSKLAHPIQAHWSRVLKRYLLDDDYKSRKKYGTIPNARGKPTEVGFFRLDDGVAWVQCWDEHGVFIPGPYKLWCISERTQTFRHMRKGDDPNFTSSRNPSRANSFDRSSRSTEFRSNTANGSTRDGPSVSSTRANSVRMTPSTPDSAVPSQVNSRRSSPRRNGSTQDDKAAMRRMAREHHAAVVAAAAAEGKGSVEQLERGRAAARAN